MALAPGPGGLPFLEFDQHGFGPGHPINDSQALLIPVPCHRELSAHCPDPVVMAIPGRHSNWVDDGELVTD